MRIISVVSSSALLALSLSGWSSMAQEAISPATAAATEDTTASVPTPPSEAASSGYSKVRIVRLSQVKGEVQMDRNTGRGFETPMANLPITEGVKLKTADGVAEVEFEDNSTVRVGMNSLVEFPRLELLPSGAKASSIHVLQGTVYVSLMNTKGNEFAVTFAKEKLNLPPDSHIRLQLTQNQAEVAVLHGDAMVDQPSGSTPVGKNKTMTFNLANDSQPVIAKNVTDAPLDAWDHQAVDYHKNFANATSYGNTSYAYGVNDMNYYGSFINGCGGSMWRPYFTSASWDPYGSGAWAYYPSAGYSWVSPYPWGWTPYHTGSWAFCNGVGWGWRPGGAWVGLANNSLIASSSPLSTRPHPPTRAPITAQATIVPVNLKAIPASSMGEHDKFVFRSNSAGLGVPRATLGKLNSFSGKTAEHGMASTNVYFAGGQHTSMQGAAGGGYAGNGAPRSSMSSSSSSASNHSFSSNMQSSAGGAGSHASAPAGGGGGRH